MRLLLDTHIFLWYIAANPSLNTDKRDLIRDPDHQVYLSLVSLWEILVKNFSKWKILCKQWVLLAE